MLLSYRRRRPWMPSAVAASTLQDGAAGTATTLEAVAGDAFMTRENLGIGGCWVAARARAAVPGRSSWPPPARGRPAPRSPPARAAEASPAPAASSSAPWAPPPSTALPVSSSCLSHAAQVLALPLLLELWWLPLRPGRRVAPAVVGAELLVGRGKWRTWWRRVGAAGAAVGWTVGGAEMATSISEASRTEAPERRSTRHRCAGGCMAGASGRSCTRRPAPPASRRAPAGCGRGTSSWGTRGFQTIDQRERFPSC